MSKPVITSISRIPMTVKHDYERYIPTAFDESFSLLEKVNKVIHYLNQIGSLANGLNEKWNEVMQWLLDNGLSEAIQDQLQEWYDDGTLADIINEEIFADLNGKVDSLNEKIENEITTLIETLEQEMLQAQKIDKLPFVDVKEYASRKNLPITKAFQECLDLAVSKGSVHLILTSGVYDLTEELRVYENTIIESVGNVVINRNHNGYILLNGNRKTEANPSTYTGYSGRGNIHIIGGTWNGNGVNYPSKASILHFAHANGLTIEGATFKDPANSHHIEFNGCKDIIVKDSKFLGWVGTTDTFNEAIQLDISKLGVTSIGADDGTPCRDVHITNCFFGNSQTGGANSIARGIGSHNATIGQKQTNINISNCVFENTLSWAIRAYNWEDVTITNNIFNNVGSGVNVRAAITGADTQNSQGQQVGAEANDNFVIAGNAFKRTTSKGRIIEIYGEVDTDGRIYGVVVADNTINMLGATVTYDAITFNYCDEISCTGNRIKNCTGNGIVVTGKSFNATVANNSIEEIGEDGVNINGANYVTVNGNVIHKIGLNGIYVSGAVGCTINDNIFAGVNGLNDADPRNHVRVVNASELMVISGNVCRNFSTSHVTSMAFYVTNTCLNVRFADNVAVGFSNSVSPANGTVDSNGNIT